MLLVSQYAVVIARVKASNTAMAYFMVYEIYLLLLLMILKVILFLSTIEWDK